MNILEQIFSLSYLLVSFFEYILQRLHPFDHYPQHGRVVHFEIALLYLCIGELFDVFGDLLGRQNLMAFLVLFNNARLELNGLLTLYLFSLLFFSLRLFLRPFALKKILEYV